MINLRRTTVRATAACALLVSLSAHAINYGEPDGDSHPFVGIMVAKDSNNNPL